MPDGKTKESRPRGKDLSPTFSCEFNLLVLSHDRRVLRSRFEAARQLYNACLGDQLKRLDAARKTPEWAKAQRLPRRITIIDAKGEKKNISNPVRRAAFQVIQAQYGLSEYSAHKHRSLQSSSWLRGHLDINTSQKVATRAFRAVEGYMYGRLGRPRFIPYTKPLESIEGKGSAGIRFVSEKKEEEEGKQKDEGKPQRKSKQRKPKQPPHIEWNSKKTRYGRGFKLSLPLVINHQDEVQTYALKHKVKYVRILRKEIRGKERFLAQLVLEGLPFAKEKNKTHKEGLIALDIGPSEVAAVSDRGEYVYRGRLASEVEPREKARRRYQRYIDRQKRANNPENYNSNGTIKPGKKTWNKSKRQLQTERSLREMERALASGRKNSHGRLANEILSYGSIVLAEKLSYKAFQKMFGRSVRFRAPGLFISILTQKANRLVNGKFIDIPTWATYLSSRCLCGKRDKKPLSKRWHSCDCKYIPENTRVQRDEFSAFLALFASEGVLNEEAAQAAWNTWGANCLLRPLNNETRVSNEVSLSKGTKSNLCQSCWVDKRQIQWVRPQQDNLVCGEPIAKGAQPRIRKPRGRDKNPRTLVLGNS